MDGQQGCHHYTGYSPLDKTKVQRKHEDRTRKEFDCPAALAAYNKFMGAVDLGDQLRGYHAYKLKGRKVYKYIYNFFMGVCVTDAFVATPSPGCP